MPKKTVYIPEKMFEEVTKKVKTKGMWANEAEFIREAVRKALEEDNNDNNETNASSSHV